MEADELIVIGTAVSGRAAAALLRSLGEKVVVYDASPAAVAGVEADDVHSGAWDRAMLDGVDLVVPSPGVPEHAVPLADAVAAGLPVWSEIELGFRHLGAFMRRLMKERRPERQVQRRVGRHRGRRRKHRTAVAVDTDCRWQFPVAPWLPECAIRRSAE